MAMQRPLTLTEELEKLEQSITLTLQEIDSNFSRAHRIVTGSVLPVVEQYAEHSRNVWEGSKFWKQFFESAANVSLNGYEETQTEQTPAPDAEAPQGVSSPQSISLATPERHERDLGQYASPQQLFSPETATPRANRNAPTLAMFASPYEKLRRQVQGKPETAQEDDLMEEDSLVPSTPRGQTFGEDSGANELDESPSQVRLPSSKRPQQNGRTNHDTLMHRVMDKNYRIQATPLTRERLPVSKPDFETPVASRKGKAASDLANIDSSPLEAPQLNSLLFSPLKDRPRIPGVSVLNQGPGTPANNKFRTLRTPAKGGEELTQRSMKNKDVITWDSDSEEEDENGMPAGMSPPKTIQFHVPQSRLLKTPAKEASKRIVDDLLMTAGGDISDDALDSPSLVRAGGLEEDTF